MDASGKAPVASTRVRLARLAERALAASDGLSPTSGRGRWSTADGERSIGGVSAAETASGRIDIALHLVAEWPPGPLESRADELRDRLLEAAGEEGIADRLGEVDVLVHDIRGPERAEAGQ